ncbi:hypothetical protein ACNKHM_27235 [Shigella sonnei]
MTAFRAALRHIVCIGVDLASLCTAYLCPWLSNCGFSVDAEYYFNPRFLSNDLAESVDLSAFTKGREAPPGNIGQHLFEQTNLWLVGILLLLQMIITQISFHASVQTFLSVLALKNSIIRQQGTFGRRHCTGRQRMHTTSGSFG